MSLVTYFLYNLSKKLEFVRIAGAMNIHSGKVILAKVPYYYAYVAVSPTLANNGSIIVANEAICAS